MLHPQALAALEAWRQGPSVSDPGFGQAGIADMRRQAREAAAAEPREDVAHVEDVDADGVRCRLFLPPAGPTPSVAEPDEPTGVGLFLHAGGNLALVTALRNPDAFAATVLVYPFIDPTGRHHEPARDGHGLSAAECAWFWEQYAAAPADLADPDLAPIGSDRLWTLPPTLVLAADQDILFGEGVELARRIEAAGGTVTLSTYPGMIHGFWRHPALFDAAEESYAEIAAFLQSRPAT